MIVSKATKVAFDGRKAELKLAEQAVVSKIRDHFLTRTQRAAIDALPQNFFNGEAVRIKSGVEGESYYWYLYGAKDLQMPHFLSQNTQVLDKGDLLTAVKEYAQAKTDLDSEEQAFKDQTAGVVYAFTQSEKLLLAWPSLETIMDPGFFVSSIVVNTLPMATINTLDEQLQLAIAA